MKLITQNLIEELNTLNKQSKQIHWIIAFAMVSGVQKTIDTLKFAMEQGAEIQILVGDYLSITQPDALAMLHNELPKADIRLFQTSNQSFHPKAYLYQSDTGCHVIVGSSNLSKSALTTGVEWNLQVVEPTIYEEALHSFSELFYAENTVSVNSFSIHQYCSIYEQNKKALPLIQRWETEEEIQLMYEANDYNRVIFDDHSSEEAVLSPRPAQQLALQALYDTQAQGYQKALVVLATGLGKTYLAAFFAKSFKRILFVAHREEILYQAKKAFEHIYPDRSVGEFNRYLKDMEADMTFASIYTLAQPHHLASFDAKHFDLIIVDEFHHAAATTYQKLLKHFDPSFLLGITATPDRLDNKDIYALCDGNVAIEIHFLEAIAKKWLTPFQYYGVKDTVDYSQIRWSGSKYDEYELFEQQTKQNTMQQVFDQWSKLKQTRTVGFCSSIQQATQLTKFFQEKGVSAATLTGQHTSKERKLMRDRLDSGDLDILFTIDLFNEGVDIPKVDTLLFIRPTESSTIFTQQIGRGLRLADQKKQCVVIDFIGNYRHAEKKLKWLSPKLESTSIQPHIAIENTEIVLHFDLEVIDLLQEILRKKQTKRQQIEQAFQDMQYDLGRTPTYLEFYLQCGIDDVPITKEYGTYIHFLNALDELDAIEKEIFISFEKLLLEVEKTNMSRSYKMVLLQTMLERGASNWYKPMTAEEVAPSFIAYLEEPSRKQIEAIPTDFNQVIRRIEQMPMTKWASSSKGLATFENGSFAFLIDIPKESENILFEWMQQICAYRLHRHFAKKSE